MFSCTVERRARSAERQTEVDLRDSPWERHGQLDRVGVERQVLGSDELCHGRKSYAVEFALAV